MASNLSNWWQRWLLSVDEATTRGLDICSAPSRSARQAPALRLSGLEPRILMSATPLDAAMMPAADEAAMVVAVEPAGTADSVAQETLARSSPEHRSSRELIVIDGAVPDLQQLLDDLSTSGRDAEVFVLDAHRDGVEQISEILDSRNGIASIHIVSHAQRGAVKLGQVWLGESNLLGYSGAIAGWQNALADGADMLFYGCDLANSSEGRALLASMRTLTGADIAASTDDTGHVSYGGNWDLEHRLGEIETEVAFGHELQQEWRGKLNTFTVDSFDDVVDWSDGSTSLREALIQVNSRAGGDTIVLLAGTYRLTNAGAAEDNGLVGDLDILVDVTIVGANAASTIIDATGLGDRVFHVQSGATLDIADVTITGGDAGSSTGGGLLAQGVLHAQRVVIRGNEAWSGGGIYAFDSVQLTDTVLTGNLANDRGGGLYAFVWTADLNRVEISNNRAGDGGGIYLHNGDLSLVNVTVSGNTAAFSGGGLLLRYDATILNSTIAFNQAGVGAAGIHTAGSGQATLQNTILYNPLGSNANGQLDSHGNNIDSDGTAALGDPLDGQNPGLDPTLRNSGGFVRTHALLAGSPAIDQGNSFLAPAVDARGFARHDQRNDIGAHEARAVILDKIYFSNWGAGKIQRANLDGSNIEDLVSGLAAAGRIGLDVDHLGGKIYWSEEDNGLIRRANLDGSGAEVVVTGLHDVREIAVDAINGKVYWSEEDATPRIRRANLDGTGIESVIVTGLAEPGGIALDVAAGKIYWVDTTAREIHRANLDGTNIEDLVDTSDGLQGPRRLQLDLAAGKMYWTDDGTLTNRILRANLDGSMIEVLVTSPSYSNPVGIDLDLARGKIYWTDFGANRIQVSDLDGSNVQNVISSGLLLPIGLALGGREQHSVVLSPVADTYLDAGDFGLNYGLSTSLRVDSAGTGLGDGRSLLQFDFSQLPVGAIITGAWLQMESTANSGAINIDVYRLTEAWDEGIHDGTFGAASWHERHPGIPWIAPGGTYDPIPVATLNTAAIGQHAWDVSLLVRDWAVGNVANLGLLLASPDAGAVSATYDSREGVTPPQLVISYQLSNAAPTGIQLDNLTIDDNTDTTAGFAVGTLTASDPDGGEQFTWSIAGGSDETLFTIGGVGGDQLILTDGILDYESKASYAVLVRVTDSALNSYEAAITISVNDLNHELPQVDGGQWFEVSELAAIGTSLGLVTASDGDAGTVFSNWTITSGNQAGIFAIDSSTGELFVVDATLLDHEVTDSYLLGITVSDGLHVSAIETIEIQVSDQNEPPTDIALDNVTVMENAAGAVIGNLSITDPDDGDSHDYEVSDNRFKIAGTQLRLRAGHQLDRETEPTVQLGITVTDRNGAGLAYHESFTLTVQDVNEAPIAGSDLYQVTAGTSLIISPSGVLADDIDPEGEALTAVLVAGPTYGTLTLRADGSFNYTPDANFTGRDMFIYLASDGLRASAATQVTINVRPAFLPPPNPAPSPAPTPVSGTDPSTDPAPEPQPAPTPPPPPSTGENDSDDESDKDKIVTVPPVGAGASQASTDRVLTPPPAEIIAASEEEQSASLTMLVESYRQASEGGGVERAIAGDTVRSAATGLFDDDFSVDTSGNIDYALMAAPGEMWNELDERVQQVESRIQGDLIVVGTAGAAASSLTVGLVAWALRTGFLASGLLAQMPAWRSFDPLLVMQGLGESGDEETLEDFVNREIESLDNVEQPETAIELERTQPFATNHSTGQL
jgi:hypothetical protein